MIPVRRSAIVLVSALVLVTLVLPAAPAAASQGFELSTFTDEDFGYATSRGQITFRTARDAVAEGGITDRCPPDSAGAYLFAQVTFMDGTGAIRQIAQDANGCGNGTRSFTSQVPNPDNKRIRYVVFKLCENDTSQPLGCFDFDLSKEKDNPFT